MALPPRVAALCALAIFCPSLSFADIVTSVSCTEGTTTVTDPSYCHAPDGGSGGASASASYSITNNTLTVVTAGNAVATATGPGIIGTLIPIVDSYVTMLLPFYGSGVTRPGFIKLTETELNIQFGPGFDDATFHYDFTGSSEAHLDCDRSCMGRQVGLIPVTLGSVMQFNLTQSLYANAIDYISTASANVNLSFQFFEADGVTSVNIAETPEPATAALFSLTLAGALIWKHKRRR